MVPIDHKIFLSMVDYCNNRVSEERGCVENSMHLFFPRFDQNYIDRLNELSSCQLQKRMRIFYDIWRRWN